MITQNEPDQRLETINLHPKHADGTPNCENCKGDGSCAKINIQAFSNLIDTSLNTAQFKRVD